MRMGTGGVAGFVLLVRMGWGADFARKRSIARTALSTSIPSVMDWHARVAQRASKRMQTVQDSVVFAKLNIFENLVLRRVASCALLERRIKTQGM